MKQINDYVLEKLHLNKDIDIDNTIKRPSSKEEWEDFINKYLREWWIYDNDNSKDKKTKYRRF